VSGGETEDWLFPCEGALDITYVPTTDADGLRLTSLPGVPVINAPGALIIKNVAAQPVTYVFIARAQVAVPLGLGYFYVDINPAPMEYTLRIAPPPGPLPVGVTFAPQPAAIPDPDELITILLDANGTPGDTIVLDVTATVNPAVIQTVVDPTPATGPNDARLGRILFHPLGPCLLRLSKTNDEPIFLQWK
jgi:hypothetical protein